MPYVRVTGRAIVNLHSANAEGAVGNYMALSKMYIVRRTGNPERPYEVTEDIVISGNMIKHWHAIKTIERLVKDGHEDDLCELCRRFVMFRTTLPENDEANIIQRCAIEDLHGFLQAIREERAVRRESIIKFAFMLPIEELRAEYTAITHNRVVVTRSGYVPSREEARKLFKAERAMEVFKREYASGVYGLACTMDLAYVGVPLANPIIEENGKFRPNIVIDKNKRKIRAKTTVLALADILTGRFGAASSRATPIMRTTELICAVSKQPIPNLIHGFYMDYAEESSKVLSASLKSGLVKDLKVFVYGDKPVEALRAEELPIEVVGSPMDALAEVARVVEEWLE